MLFYVRDGCQTFLKYVVMEYQLLLSSFLLIGSWSPAGINMSACSTHDASQSCLTNYQNRDPESYITLYSLHEPENKHKVLFIYLFSVSDRLQHWPCWPPLSQHLLRNVTNTQSTRPLPHRHTILIQAITLHTTMMAIPTGPTQATMMLLIPTTEIGRGTPLTKATLQVMVAPTMVDGQATTDSRRIPSNLVLRYLYFVAHI